MSRTKNARYYRTAQCVFPSKHASLVNKPKLSLVMSYVSFALDVLRLVVIIICQYVESFYRILCPARPKDVRGQVVVVTGAASGIGRQLAIQLALRGARIAVWDVNEDGATETATAIQSMNVGNARAYACDVTRSEEVRRAASLVRQELGFVDILVNNAGIWYCRELLDLSEEEIRKTFEVNTLSHFWTLKEFLPDMVERDCGHIVTMSSMAAKGGSVYCTDYGASKWAVYGMTESLYDEMRVRGKKGIFFTTVCPMFVNTNMIRHIAARANPVGSMLSVMEPEEVAEVVVQDILKNHRYSYVPRIGGWTAIQDFMPQMVKNSLSDFVRFGGFS